MDRGLLEFQKRNIAVFTVICIRPEVSKDASAYRNYDHDLGMLFQHPDFSEPAGTNGVYSMVNLDEAKSVNYWAAALDFMASRYSDGTHGRIFTASIFKCNSWSLSSNFFRCNESCAVQTCEYASKVTKHNAIVAQKRFINLFILFILSLPNTFQTLHTYLPQPDFQQSIERSKPLSAVKRLLIQTNGPT